VRPRQLSQQRRDFFIVPVGLVKLPHAKQVWSRKTSQSRLCAGNVVGKLVYHTITPFGIFDLAADIGSNLPIEIYQGRICDVNGSSFLLILFLGFAALIILFQFIPGMVLFATMLKGLFTPAPKKAAETVKLGVK